MDSRLKLIFAVVILFMIGMPLSGILRGTKPPPPDSEALKIGDVNQLPNPIGFLPPSVEIIKEQMVFIPPGEFIQGTLEGGFNERPERTIMLKGYWIDRYEVTNHQYLEFVEATGHRKPGPPSRYAKRLGQLRGANQPITYVSWRDAHAYCQWQGKHLPNEAQWEKAMRGTDGRLWPWGNSPQKMRANLGGVEDGFEATSPVGVFPQDRSPYGVMDGFGNLMEWVDNWYEEQITNPAATQQVKFADRGGYKTLRGSGYTSQGNDLRITNRSFMVPDFRDESIGFRCAADREKKSDRRILARPKK